MGDPSPLLCLLSCPLPLPFLPTTLPHPHPLPPPPAPTACPPHPCRRKEGRPTPLLSFCHHTFACIFTFARLQSLLGGGDPCSLLSLGVISPSLPMSGSLFLHSLSFSETTTILPFYLCPFLQKHCLHIWGGWGRREGEASSFTLPL